jgi:hypothetical protein
MLINQTSTTMNNFFRALIAGYGAKKLGGGCLSTIVIFIVIYTLLGKCNDSPRAAMRPQNMKGNANHEMVYTPVQKINR